MDVSLHIAGFGGLDQSADEGLLPMSKSPDARNGCCRGRVLSTAAGCAPYIDAPLPGPAITPILYYHYATDGTITRHVLAATENDILRYTGGGWASIRGGQSIGSGDFSACAYARQGEASMLILSNGVDPVYRWDGSGNIYPLFYQAGPPVREAPRGGSLTIHAERLWVSAIAGAPNDVYASDAYNPAGWEQSAVDAGMLRLSTWDGGHIIGLAQLLGDVVVFKQRSIFRIVGTYPEEFEPVQVLTLEGTIAPRSLCQYNNAAFFMADDGIMVYRGLSAEPLLPAALGRVYGRMNRTALPGACGIVHNDVLYMAVPLDGSATNNAVITYDLLTGAAMVLEGLAVRRWAQDDETLLFAGYDATLYEYGAGTTFHGAPVSLLWRTPSTDMGRPDAVKSLYEAYVDGWSASPGPNLRLTALADGTEAARADVTLPQNRFIVRVPLRADGRRMGLKIENIEGSAVNIAAIRAGLELTEDL